MYKFKKSFSNFYKFFIYKIFKLIYGKIESIYVANAREDVIEEKIILSENSYKLYHCKNSILYTDRIHDLAIIKDNSIINGPSFQYRNNEIGLPVNEECRFNSVFKKGTPRFKKKLKGSVFSLLTGGGGNHNYWHWLFDVLPRLGILEKSINNKNIDFYLFPDLNQTFQKESLDLLNLPELKRLSSKVYRHLSADEIVATSHPYNLLNDPLVDSLYIPQWIIDFLKKNFLSKIKSEKNEKKVKKIFINRKDGKTFRFISNEKEVEKFLVRKGFQSLTLSNYNFLEQIKIFNNAEYIIGLHGAGFANTIFSQPKTKILELKAVTAGDAIKNLVENNNLIYNHLSFVNKTFNFNDQNGDIEVDINLLNKTLGSTV
jgi:capsular polysaccharide biosynthesis protein